MRTAAILALCIAAAAAVETVRTVEALGPFAVGAPGSEPLRVFASYREIPDAAPQAFARALESWRVEGPGGATLLEESRAVALRPDGSEFEEESSLWAGRLVGGPRPLLLVEIGFLPSAPGSGVTWRVFDLEAGSRLVEVARFEQQGGGVRNERRPDGDVPLNSGRSLDVDWHFGYFSLVFRYELDEATRRFTARHRCATPLHARREPEAAVERAARGGGPVVLRERPDAASAGRTVDPLSAASVELLEACLDRPPAPDEPLDADGRSTWVRVRVDAAEGWLPAAELDRLGFVASG